jgi:hypothetical protein
MGPHRNLILRSLVLLLVMTAALLFSIAWYGMQNTVPAGFTVDGWNAGTISLTEFEQQLNYKRKLLLEQPIRLVSSGTVPALPPMEWTLEQLGLEIPIQQVLDQLRPLRAGSPWHKAVNRWKLRYRQAAIPYAIDTARLHERLVRGLPALYEQQPVSAQRIVGPTDTISYVPETYSMRIDEAALLEQLERAIPLMANTSWTAGIHRPDTRARAAGELPTRLSFAPAAAPAPAPAAASAPTRAPIDIALPLVKQQPPVTLRELQAQGVERKISEFTTTFLQNGEGRIHNIRSTAASIHDLLMKPGDVFDYASYIAQTEAQFGFKEAPVIVGGKLVPGIGGGICQVSTTLYNAVLRAGLSIVERRNHSLPVSYVPLGQDATFASGHINFRFRNSTDHYLLIRTATSEQQITVKLFGQTPPDLTYSVESKTIETLLPMVKYVANPTLPTGKQQKLSDGKPGYIVETYRYKKQNGRTVGQERISRDTYAAQPTVIAVRDSSPEGNNAKPDRAYKPPLVEDGVKGPVFR